ncbi:hypothetical protein N656DRAFT_132931 [Canariomyces notabilis]|uniref:Uncharacterized protein n=1 Tax=Canariomyces notabilis TaxID=2074819 RepID=A0AAN6YRY5_9PEZI|nr:hypothetical protein N656DRAFT_132931 [Canariomyces arenarius]
MYSWQGPVSTTSLLFHGEAATTLQPPAVAGILGPSNPNPEILSLRLVWPFTNCEAVGRRSHPVVILLDFEFSIRVGSARELMRMTAL